MLSSVLTFFLYGGLVSAGTLPVSFARSTSNLTALTANDIIVYGEGGRIEVWPKAKYEYLSSLDNSVFSLTSATPLPRINSTSSQSNSTTSTNSALKSKSKRKCSSQTIIVENPDSGFLNWDVPMTSVVHATGLTNIIQISEGYSIANAVAVSEAASFTLVKDFLSTTYSIQYTETWTTTTTSAYSFYVQPGSYGAIVSNPRTTRKTGTVYEGCIGDSSSVSTYTADSYTSQSWGSLAWVTGIITLCNGTAYPLPMCIGNGFLY